MTRRSVTLIDGNPVPAWHPNPDHEENSGHEQYDVSVREICSTYPVGTLVVRRGHVVMTRSSAAAA